MASEPELTPDSGRGRRYRSHEHHQQHQQSISYGHHQTPSKSTNVTLLQDDAEEEPDLTITETGCSARERFTDIENNVNQALSELDSIYSQIGYLAPEIAMKKTEIFTVVNETVLNYVGSLQREKNNIENECEWLRQQIRIILAIVNDRSGTESLDIVSQGIVFNDTQLYEEGYRTLVMNKMNSGTISCTSTGPFLESSPFNLDSLSQLDIVPNGSLALAQTDYLLRNIPQLSMLQLKARLNGIFLECLKIFVVKFKQFTDLNLTYAEYAELIGEDIINDKMSKVLPTRTESEEHRQLIRQFESILCLLHMNLSKQHPQSIILLSGKNDDSQAFIISSPRKNLRLREREETLTDNNSNGLSQLRDLNYQLVTVIRNLKITKLSPEFMQRMNDDISQYETLVAEREAKLQDTINRCIECIEMLQLTDDKLIELQKRNEASSTSNVSSTTEYFDLDTLRFISTNPRQFGLSNAYFTYIEAFLKLLEHKRTHKQQKFDHYFDKCKDLWEKLTESPEYVKAFTASNNSLNDTCLMNLKMELNRLHLRRAEFVDSFIMESREQISELWDKLFYGEEQRSEFRYYHLNLRGDDDLDKEKVLKVHEQECEKLKQEFKDKGKILQLYGELERLVEDRKFLDESSKDPSRLLSKNKNSCRNLLIEEKKRKHLSRRMPIVLATLKSEISSYNKLKLQAGGKYITFGGVDLFEKVLVIESEYNMKTCRSSKIRSPVKTKATASTSSSSSSSSSSSFSSIRKPPIPSRSTSRILSSRTASSTRSNSSMTLSKDPSPMKRGMSRGGIAPSHLQPLNSPLKTLHQNHHKPSIHEAINADSTHCSTLYGASSPLKLSMNHHSHFNSFTNSVQGSPLRNGSQMFNEGEKENYELSPVKVPTTFTPMEFQTTAHDIELQSDSSTLVGGDEYLMWKDKRMRDLNADHCTIKDDY